MEAEKESGKIILTIDIHLDTYNAFQFWQFRCMDFNKMEFNFAFSYNYERAEGAVRENVTKLFSHGRYVSSSYVNCCEFKKTSASELSKRSKF